MNVKLTHPNAKVPTKAHPTDAGWDLYVAENKTAPGSNQMTYDFGIAFEIPKGWVGLIFPRSSVSTKTCLSLANSVGVIDENFRGSVRAVFDILSRDNPTVYRIGERAAQIVFLELPVVEELTVVDNLSKTDRGEGGFGSSGK